MLGTGLAPAELSAARLDGDITELGFSFVPIDVPSRASTRARSLAVSLPERFIVDRRSAAWVHGAIERLPERLEACVSTSARPSALARFGGSVIGVPFDGTVREVVITGDEIVSLDGVLVTTPLRTVFDLLRVPEFDTEVQVIVQRLAALSSLTLDACEHYLTGRPHLPRKSETLARLGHVLA